jgi:hypothetical protein
MLLHCTSDFLHPTSSILTTAYPPRCDLVLSLCEPLSRMCANKSQGAGLSRVGSHFLTMLEQHEPHEAFLVPMPAVGVDLFLSVLYHTALHTPACIPTGQLSIGACVPMAHAIACITSLQPHFRQELSLYQTLHLQLCAYLSCFIPTAQRG